jgi:hypothetical protein
MSRVYDDRALDVIASTVGPCLDGRDRGEMLKCIEEAAQDCVREDFPTRMATTARSQLAAAGADPALIAFVERGWSDYPREPSHANDKTSLLKLAALVREAERLSQKLGLHGAILLARSTIERGCSQSSYLTDYAEAAEAAASSVDVKSRGDTELRYFICALADIVEHFCGWRRVCTVDRVYSDGEDDIVDEARYSGRFFEAVQACIEPLGIKKSDATLAKTISRALAKDTSAA